MAKKDGDTIVMDGSVLEGGGQILRNSISLTAILNKSVYISKIRAGRSNPGLRAQHMTGILLVADIAKGDLSSCTQGSTEVSFTPHGVHGGNYKADAKTAGSICLLAQVSLPVLVFANKPSFLTLLGGTDADMAPPIDFYRELFVPYVEKMGVTVSVNVVKRGYYPKGGGMVELNIQPVAGALKPINLVKRGPIVRIRGRSFVAGVLPKKMAHEMRTSAENVLRRELDNVEFDIEVIQEDEARSFGNGSGILLVAETAEGCLLGAAHVGKRELRAHQVGRNAAEDLLKDIYTEACCDSHMQDQLIIFMALADGQSCIRTGPVTLHTQTAIFVAQQLTDAKFTVEEDVECRGSFLISCQGIGLKRNS